MWTCPKCGQKFVVNKAYHSCLENSVDNMLFGKSQHTIELFLFFIEEYEKIGKIVLHPSKSRIAFAAKIRFGYIHRLGRNYVDVVFQFRKNYKDSKQFYKIAQVPNSNIFNHYVRIKAKEDITSQLKEYMQLAYDIGLRKHLEP
ncbi:MAG: hypothetical protein ISR55_05590 [Bacteroidetes bacterium]|nr:hypothetical protein [Bacteroidota bacterium]MBL6963276.1 hypothetical protein [Bacteroidota bacterium]